MVLGERALTVYAHCPPTVRVVGPTGSSQRLAAGTDAAAARRFREWPLRQLQLDVDNSTFYGVSGTQAV
jgi:hypothetical protein